MVKQSTTGGLTPDALAAVLSKAGGTTVTPQMIATDVESGAPVDHDGSINLIRYTAWLLKQARDGRD